MATKGLVMAMQQQGARVGFMPPPPPSSSSSSSSSSSAVSAVSVLAGGARRRAAREKYTRWVALSTSRHNCGVVGGGDGISNRRNKKKLHANNPRKSARYPYKPSLGGHQLSKRIVQLYSNAQAQAHDHEHGHDHDHEIKNGEVSLDEWVEGLKWDDKGYVVAIAQDVDTGAVLMQAFANREAVKATVKTKLGTFYSRSRKGLWCKGESSGNLLHIKGVYADCDSDSLIYLCKPVGPACHTGAPTCWFESVSVGSDSDKVSLSRETPYGTLQVLENTIKDRRAEILSAVNGKDQNKKPSWTAKLLTDEALLCSKVREEAGELCETLEKNEGKERTASEMADLLYHAMVLLRTQDVDVAEVLEILRGRFSVSGIEEKAARPSKK